MKRKYINISLIVIAILAISIFLLNSPSENFNDANFKFYGGKKNLVLKGRRPLMSHDLISIINRKTYVDSIYFQIPFNGSGTLNGEKIEVEKGNYKYKGKIKIDKENVTVDLYLNNFDDKKLMPSEWNGKYELNKNGL